MVNPMRYDIATDEQLLSIIKNDVNCPTHLMCGVVDETIKRNLFEKLMIKAIRMRFTLIKIACNRLFTTKEDLLQILKTEVWVMAHTFKPGKAPFGYFAYMIAYRKLAELEKAFDYGRKGMLKHQESMELQVSENVRLEDCLSSKANVERTVINKITFEEKLSVLSEGERKVFLLYLKGYSFTEIAQMIRLSKTGVNKRMDKAMTKLSGGRKIKLNEFNISNYKVGA